MIFHAITKFPTLVFFGMVFHAITTFPNTCYLWPCPFPLLKFIAVTLIFITYNTCIKIGNHVGNTLARPRGSVQEFRVLHASLPSAQPQHNAQSLSARSPPREAQAAICAQVATGHSLHSYIVYIFDCPGFAFSFYWLSRTLAK